MHVMENIQDILQKFSRCATSVIGKSLSKIIVYGSYARGDYDRESDIDIMILTSLTDGEIESVENKLYDIAFEFMMDYGIRISVIVKNEDHFRYWLGALPFYDNVAKEGIEVVG